MKCTVMIWRSWVRTLVGLNLGCLALLSVMLDPKLWIFPPCWAFCHQCDIETYLNNIQTITFLLQWAHWVFDISISPGNTSSPTQLVLASHLQQSTWQCLTVTGTRAQKLGKRKWALKTARYSKVVSGCISFWLSRLHKLSGPFK